MPAPHTPKKATVARPPTRRQLSYLKSLAERTGQTFTYPRTAAEASRQIDRLRAAPRTSRTERYVERKAIADQIATGPVHDGTGIREDEITGRGSTATWTHNRAQPPTAAPTAPPRRTPVVGQRTELARYRISAGERVLYGQRIDGIVRITDRPASSEGRSFLVERGLQTKAELDALVIDYINQAGQLDAVPAGHNPLEAIDASTKEPTP